MCIYIYIHTLFYNIIRCNPKRPEWNSQVQRELPRNLESRVLSLRIDRAARLSHSPLRAPREPFLLCRVALFVFVIIVFQFMYVCFS